MSKITVNFSFDTLAEAKNLINSINHENGKLVTTATTVAPAGNGQVGGGSGPVRSQKFYNVYRNRPSENAYDSRDEADDAANAETRQAVLVITRYESGDTKLELMDARA